jgi:hypothetical protein
MAFDFEALVGHLYIVGGRSISAQPPGILVEVAPKKAARGRELDTIFILAMPTDEVTAPPAFYEQMATLAAERYFSSTGSVTAGLRSIFNSLNQDLTEHNLSGKRHYEANLVCAVLREDELFVARVGAGVGLYHHQGTTSAFPADFGSEDSLFGPPLGVQPVPDIKMSKFAVAQGSRLLLADSRLVDLDMQPMKEALSRSEVADVIDGLKALSPAQLTLIAAEFVPPDAPSPASVKDVRASTRTPAPGEAPEESADQRPPAQPGPRPHEDSVLVAQAQRGAGLAALLVARIFSGINTALDRLFPPPPEGGRSWLRSSTATAIVVLLPVAIVGLVVIMGLGQVDQSEFELCVQDAVTTAGIARGINSSDRNGTLQAWNAVTAQVNRCKELRPGADPSLDSLLRDAQSVIDALGQIDRRQLQLIESFPNALLTRVVLQGLDMYVLDSQNQRVYRVSLTGDGRTAVADSTTPIAAMRRGAVVGSSRVGDLIDIAWSDETTQIIALDRNGLLIECSPRFLQDCQTQQLLAAERWGNPTNMTFWQGRLYLLDPGKNQIWRYDSSGGAFGSSPIEYFATENRPDITPAVGFGIDDQGYVYVLNANGQLTRWVTGSQTPFTWVSFPDGQTLTTADALYLNTDPLDKSLWIVSRASRTIFNTSLAGTFFNAYRAFNEEDFANLTSVIADPTQQVIYALAGNAIFVFDKVRPPGT